MQYWKAIVWSCIILYVSFINGEKIPQNSFFDMVHADKIVHFSIYFIQTFLFIAVNKNKEDISIRKKYLPAVIIGLITGLLTEFVQGYLISAHRSADIFDFLANTMGIVSACLLFNVVYKLLKKYKLDFIV